MCRQKRKQTKIQSDNQKIYFDNQTYKFTDRKIGTRKKVINMHNIFLYRFSKTTFKAKKIIVNDFPSAKTFCVLLNLLCRAIKITSVTDWLGDWLTLHILIELNLKQKMDIFYFLHIPLSINTIKVFKNAFSYVIYKWNYTYQSHKYKN